VVVALWADFVIIRQFLGIQQLTALWAFDPKILGNGVFIAMIALRFRTEFSASLKEIAHVRGIPNSSERVVVRYLPGIGEFPQTRDSHHRRTRR
jgi:hypothetical protein